MHILPTIITVVYTYPSPFFSQPEQNVWKCNQERSHVSDVSSRMKRIPRIKTLDEAVKEKHLFIYDIFYASHAKQTWYQFFRNVWIVKNVEFTIFRLSCYFSYFERDWLDYFLMKKDWKLFAGMTWDHIFEVECWFWFCRFIGFRPDTFLSQQHPRVQPPQQSENVSYPFFPSPADGWGAAATAAAAAPVSATT